MYSILRWIASIALHWFYRDIRVIGRERIPLEGPLLIAVNHQNALVDSLIVGWLIPRRVTMTAKATLAENPIMGLLFRLLHVVPLRRVRDELEGTRERVPDPERNRRAFREIIDVLEDLGAVLLFPEGKSHNKHTLEPLKTGLARLALQASTERGIAGIKILPIGLVFEDKGAPNTVVGARIGEVIEMDCWARENHLILTEEIARRLREASEEASLPSKSEPVGRRKNGLLRKGFIMVAAWWGRVTHHLPIRIARNIAVQRSTDADQPATLTILFGIGLVILTYVIHVTVVGILLHSLLAAVFYLVSLLCGAYHAAFQEHRKRP